MNRKLRNRFGKIGFVLASGGVKGAWMAGNFLAFKEFGIFPDYISSCSVGSLNAAGLVSSGDLALPSVMWQDIKGPSSIFEKNAKGRGGVLSEVAERLANINDKKTFLSFYTEFAVIGTKVIFNYRRIKNAQSLLSSEPLERLMRRLNFEDVINSPIEFEVICANKKNNKKSIFSNRRITDPEIFFRAVMASASISGIFPPVDVLEDGELYVDGVTSDPLPIHNALEANCKTIFLFCLHPENAEVEIDENSKQSFLIRLTPRSLKNYLSMQDAQFGSYETNINNLTKYLPPDIYILRPEKVPEGIETLFIDEEKRDWLIKDGYESAKRLLKNVLNLVPAA